jgi:hypothetical protein
MVFQCVPIDLFNCLRDLEMEPLALCGRYRTDHGLANKLMGELIAGATLFSAREDESCFFGSRDGLE